MGVVKMPLKRALSRPKILYLTPYWPWAPAYGGQQRALNIARLLGRSGDVSAVVVSVEPEEEETVRRTKRELQVSRVIQPQVVAPRGLIRGIPQKLQHEFDPKCMDDLYVIGAADRAALEALVQQHDLTWVFTLRLANWFRIYHWHRSVLDVDELPSRVYQSRLQWRDESPWRRLLDGRMYWIWRRREHLLSERFSVLSVCSEADRSHLGGRQTAYVIPNGAHDFVARRGGGRERSRIGFLGNCAFPPNAEGLQWFIRDVWPRIKRECPQAELRLAGRETDARLAGLGPDIAGLGWIEDPGDEIATWSAMVVPVKFGSGTRVKVAEGFARRCPIVATTIGAFGYDAVNGEVFLLADSARDFAAACVSLLRDPQRGEAMAERAHRHFLQKWAWESSASTVEQAVRECLAKSKPAENRGRG
jgi:glycosyltransferase involved in cell wall biosynthesis